MLAFVHTVKRNRTPLTAIGSRQGHPLAWHSAWAAAKTVALTRFLDRSTLPSSLIASKMRAHQTYGVCVKELAGARCVIGPCIAVMGMMPGSA